MSHVSSLKGFNSYHFVIWMVVLQYDMSVSCHIFHPSMRNSGIQITAAETDFKAYFYLGVSCVFSFADFHFLYIHHSRCVKVDNLSQIRHSNNIKISNTAVGDKLLS